MAAPIHWQLHQQNRLLRALAPATLRRLLPTVEPVALRLREILIQRHAPIRWIYFPLDAVVSVIGELADGTTLEVATIGNEGLVGLPQFLQATTMPFTAFVQIPGAALRMEAEAFGRAVRAIGSDFHTLLARYTQVWCNQLGWHALCNRLHPIDQRCARWLLLTHDRVGRADFPLTQEFLAAMLGVRRSSVTEVAGRLQRAGLIQSQRGTILILDRLGLEKASCACYYEITQEAERLLAPVQV
jgi:CRP-like cAMP-binding protein